MSLSTDNIRNVMIVGHQSCGKTTLCESLAFKSGLIAKKGSIESKNTISDFTSDEQKKLCSLSTSIIPLKYKENKINLIDIPGNDDFVFELQSAVKLFKAGIVVIDATKGVQVCAVKYFHNLHKKKIPMFIYINKTDKENINYTDLFNEIQTKLSKACLPFTCPTKDVKTIISTIDLNAYTYDGKNLNLNASYNEDKSKASEYHSKLEEIVAGTDDSLLEKYFNGDQLTDEEIKSGLRSAVLNCEVFPVIIGSSLLDNTSAFLLDSIIDYLPSPKDLQQIAATNMKKEDVKISCDVNEKTSLMIFKNLYNSYQGLISIFKVTSGVVHVGDELYCSNNGKKYKVSTLFSVVGEKLVPTNEVIAGDIGAITKLDDLKLSYTLSSNDYQVMIPPVKYPTAVYNKGVIPASKNDSDKLFPTLEKMQLEDPTIVFEKNQYTNQIIVGSLSSSHLQFILDKVKDNNKINFTLEKPKVVYKETITTKGDAEGRYVKQSGGSGAYGVVNMSFEPDDHTSFQSTVFGGHIDKGYFPAVEKGFNEAILTGGLIGAPVINVKATLTDGKQHPVDSNELAFRNAAIDAFKKAYSKCKPILLEPYDKIVITVDSDYMGPILSDLSKRRGRILSSDEGEDGTMNISAFVPEAEIQEYANDLKSITKGTGFYNLHFEDYERVPDALANTIIANSSSN